MDLVPQNRSITGRHLRRKQLTRVASVVVLAALVGVGCGAKNAPRYVQNEMAAPAAAMKVHASTLSREHSLMLDVSESEIATKFGRVSDRCAQDTQHHCTILQSDLSTGATPSGSIKLRIDPDAVEDLVSFVSGLGKLEHRSTTVEDLADAIQDTQSRIEMLTSYRKQLLALQSKTGNNVEAAIKLASELSTVQTDLERASGEAAYQTKRTTTDIVQIAFMVAERRVFWRPVREALDNFAGNFSNGVSEAVTAVAYIVPWLFVAVPGWYLMRFLWRRRVK